MSEEDEAEQPVVREDGTRRSVLETKLPVDKPELPEEVLAEARDAFAMFADGAGRMNVRHLYAALRSMGVDATDDDVIAVVDEHDPDGRGHIAADQWTAAMARRWAEDGARRRRFRGRLAAGDVVDSRGATTGQATVDHVRAVLRSFDPAAVTDADVDEMVAAANYAGLGYVDYDEFVATMVRPARLDRYLQQQ